MLAAFKRSDLSTCFAALLVYGLRGVQNSTMVAAALQVIIMLLFMQALGFVDAMLLY
jgi:hypothetical protein